MRVDLRGTQPMGRSVRAAPRADRRQALLLALAALLWLVFACSPGGSGGGPEAPIVSIDQLSPAASGSARLSLVASTSIVGDVLANVGGSDVDLRILIPAGGDPHGFTPAPADLRALQGAGAVFVSGLGLEQAILPELAAGGVPIVSISEGIQALAFGPDGVESAATAYAADAELDPHVWMDPNNVILWAQNAAEALSRLDPEHGPNYQSRASAYIDDLRHLDSWIRDQTQRLAPERRKMVTDHYALGYYAQRYGFQVVGAIVPAASSMAEPSPRSLAALQDQIRQFQVPAIFVEHDAQPSSYESLAQDVGAEIVPLYIGALTAPDGPASTYIDLMRTDTQRIVEALSK